MFSDAKRALEDHRYFKLLELAEEFKVATPRNYAQQIRWMKKESVALAQLIQVEKDTYNYMFAECESDGARDKLIRRFMIQIFGPQIFSNNG